MTTLVAEAIQYAISAGFRSVNLSTGDDVSKRRWRPREIPFGELEIVAPTWPGRLMHDSFTRARNGFRQVLPAYWRLVTRRER